MQGRGCLWLGVWDAYGGGHSPRGVRSRRRSESGVAGDRGQLTGEGTANAQWKMSTRAITQLGSHLTNTATASVHHPWIYRYNIKTPDVLVYIFSRRQGRSARISKHNASLVRQTSCFSQRVSCPLLGTIPDMRRPMNNSDVCGCEILYNPRLLGVWQRLRCPATTGSRPSTDRVAGTNPIFRCSDPLREVPMQKAYPGTDEATETIARR